MVFNLLVNLYFLVSLVIPYWVQIGMNHISPHPLMMTPLLSFIYTFKGKSGHELARIIHQDDLINVLLLSEILIIITWVLVNHQLLTKKLPL